MVRPAFMHHCFAAAWDRQNRFEFQIVPGVNACIMLARIDLQEILEKIAGQQ